MFRLRSLAMLFVATLAVGGCSAGGDAPATAGPSPTSLRFTRQASDARAGAPITPPIEVVALDESGSVVSTYSGPVTLSLGANPNEATLQGTVTVNAVQGVATFDDVIVSVSGDDYTLLADTPETDFVTGAEFDISPTSGNFAAPLELPAIGVSGRLAAADLDGDGNQDLAVPFLPGGVATLLGNGDGTFRAGFTVTAGQAPSSVAVADFDADGRPDLVTSDFGADTVSVMLGNGDGSFGPPAAFPVGSQPGVVLVFDWNGDGRVDAATSNSGPGSSTVSLLLGRGDGTFAAATAFQAGVRPVGLTTGDLSNRGVWDLVVANGTTRRGSALLGQGGGSFGGPIDVFANPDPRSSVVDVALGDFNDDGALDAVLANGAFDNVSLVLGAGDGIFGPNINFAVGGNPRAFSAQSSATDTLAPDLNLDGQPDLVTANVNDSLGVLFGGGNDFIARIDTLHLAPGAAPVGVVVADFNGDGRPDLASAGANNVSILLQQ